MKELREFRIPFIGLKEGEHRFEYQIDNKFFDAFQYDEFIEVDLKVSLLFVKKATMLELEFTVEGTVNVPCDLTGEPFDLTVTGELSLIVKFGEEYNDDHDEILVVPNSAHQINVSQYIYEMIALSVPVKRVSPKGKNEKVGLEKLEELKVKENKTKTEDITDPRWGKLKDLLIDKNHHNGTSKEKDI